MKPKSPDTGSLHLALYLRENPPAAEIRLQIVWDVKQIQAFHAEVRRHGVSPGQMCAPLVAEGIDRAFSNINLEEGRIILKMVPDGPMEEAVH